MAGHTFRQGDQVVVPIQGGNVRAAGPALVIALINSDHLYLVRFDSEPGMTYQRVVETK